MNTDIRYNMITICKMYISIPDNIIYIIGRNHYIMESDYTDTNILMKIKPRFCPKIFGHKRQNYRLYLTPI